MKDYFILPKAPELEPHHYIQNKERAKGADVDPG